MSNRSLATSRRKARGERMGVRITLFAVDLSQFSSVIHQSLWDWLWYYVDHGTPDKDAFRTGINDEEKTTFLARPQVGVVARVGAKEARLSRLNKPNEPLLTKSLQDHLGDSPWGLKELLTALSHCPSNKSVRLLTQGNRRWWIGSFLEYSEYTLGPNAPDYIYLASLFQRMLRGYDCGKVLPKSDTNVNDVPFPVLMQDDPDLRMSVWTDEETCLVVEIIRSIMNKDAKFAMPPSTVGIAPANDEDWNDWVHKMIGHILAIDAFPPAMRTVVGFIL
jgi:hypothetical protein